MRLIDADAFLKRNEELADCDFYHPKIGSTLQDIVDMEPTVGETTRPVFNGRFWECEECGHEYSDILVVKKYSYCPWCGRRIEWN